jgi:hypothetical protein
MQAFGTQNPRATVTVGSTAHRTRVHSHGGSKGIFNEKFTFSFNQVQLESMAVVLMNTGEDGAEEVFIGSCR